MTSASLAPQPAGPAISTPERRAGDICVGFAGGHGMAREICAHPPAGVHYTFLTPKPEPRLRLIRSPIKGYMRSFDTSASDVVEAIMTPIRTSKPWILSCANLQETVAFNLLGAPLPRAVRVGYLEQLMRRDNFGRLIVWSEYGRSTVETYGGIRNARVLDKVSVVYPAVREVSDEHVQFSRGDVTLLFSGAFFRKGGVNVLDAFERAQQKYPGLRLILCCHPQIDFVTPNAALRAETLDRIQRLSGIESRGRVTRDILWNEILPRTDIYLLPTYIETFGMAVVEAMAFGIPVIATNQFATPEMIEDEVSGLMLDVKRWDCERRFRDYQVHEIDPGFREDLSGQLYRQMCRLIESPDLRERTGRAALAIARTKFSFAERNARMLEIYRAAMHS